MNKGAFVITRQSSADAMGMGFRSPRMALEPLYEMLPLLCCSEHDKAIQGILEDRVTDDEPNLNWFNQERDPTGADPECFDQTRIGDLRK